VALYQELTEPAGDNRAHRAFTDYRAQQITEFWWLIVFMLTEFTDYRAHISQTAKKYRSYTTQRRIYYSISFHLMSQIF
jgi:hypothetical protein